MQHSEKFLAIVDDAKGRIREITVAEVKADREDGAAIVLVDVREDREWNAARAAGAIHLGKGIIERDIEKIVPDVSAKVVLYCWRRLPLRSGGGCPAEDGLRGRLLAGWRLARLERRRDAGRARRRLTGIDGVSDVEESRLPPGQPDGAPPLQDRQQLFAEQLERASAEQVRVPQVVDRLEAARAAAAAACRCPSRSATERRSPAPRS